MIVTMAYLGISLIGVYDLYHGLRGHNTDMCMIFIMTYLDTTLKGV